MIISEVLDAIDIINSITIESEIDTCKSLLSSYDKMLLIEEHYEGDDINGFKIFQEAQTESPKKNQGIFRTIINGIKTLFKAIAQWFQNIFNPQKVKQAEDNVKKCKKLGKKERAAIFGALGLVTVASVAAVNNHKKKDGESPKNDNDENIEKVIDKAESDENKNTNSELKEVQEVIEKSNKKCYAIVNKLEQEFNVSVEAKNPFANQKRDFGWDNRKQGYSRARKYPCITYDIEHDEVRFTYNIYGLTNEINSLKQASDKFIKFFNKIIESVNKNESIDDKYIDDLYESLNGPRKPNKFVSTRKKLRPEPSDNMFLYIRKNDSDENVVVKNLEEIIQNFNNTIPVDDFNKTTQEYSSIIKKINDPKIFNAIADNGKLIKELREFSKYYQDKINIIKPMLELLNQAILQYNAIMAIYNKKKNKINSIDYKPADVDSKNVEKMLADKQNELLEDMKREYEKYMKANSNINKKERKTKQNELIKKYIGKGLHVPYKNDYAQYFGETEEPIEEEEDDDLI